MAAVMLTGCATVSPVIDVPEFCTLYDPVYTPRSLAPIYPAVDAQIQANNARWLCLCEGDCPGAVQ